LAAARASARAAKGTRSQERRSAAVDRASASDQLTLTDIGRYLASSTNEPPVDRERVDTIRQALADGSYEIDSARVAAKLLQLDRELI
jgi:negative regulator of flagellin synthesis FlgM